MHNIWFGIEVGAGIVLGALIVIIIVIGPLVAVIQGIAGRYRMQRVIEAERVERERSIGRQLEAEALAERKRVAGEQQKAYEKRSKRADKIRQVKNYYKDSTE